METYYFRPDGYYGTHYFVSAESKEKAFYYLQNLITASKDESDIKFWSVLAKQKLPKNYSVQIMSVGQVASVEAS